MLWVAGHLDLDQVAEVAPQVLGPVLGPSQEGHRGSGVCPEEDS